MDERYFSSNPAAASTEPSKKGKKKRQKMIGEDKKSCRDEEEQILESFLFGKQEMLLEKLSRADDGIKDTMSEDDEKSSMEGGGDMKPAGLKSSKPAWVDEDDEEFEKEFQNQNKKASTSTQHSEENPKDSLRANHLRREFERVTGAPSWAKLPSEKKNEKKRKKTASDDSDSDEERFLQTTGNYITAAPSLAPKFLQIKKCRNANQKAPSGSRLTSVEFHKQAQVMLTASHNHRVVIFQVDGKMNTKIESIYFEQFPVSCAHFGVNRCEVIAGSCLSKSFYTYDMMAGKICKIPRILALDIDHMGNFQVSPDGKMLAFAGRHGEIHLLSAKSKEYLTSVKMSGSVESFTFDQSGRQLYSFGDDGEVYVWDMAQRQCVHKFYDESCVQGTVIAADSQGKYIACGSNTGVVNIYNTKEACSETGPKPLKSILNLTTSVSALVFNSTSEILSMISDSKENAVKLFHVPSKTVFANFPEVGEKSMKFATCHDFSKHSGYYTLGNNNGHALLFSLPHYGNY